MSEVPQERQEEQPLGGNWSASVRIGDTVHRRAGFWTPAIQALLAHLERVGFDAAPRALGMDAQGRAVQTFLPGEVHMGWPEPMPAWMYEDETTLVGAAQLLRRYHDALATFVPPSDARWRFVAPRRHEVICHYDWAPYNALFKGRQPIALLDWDSAGPGPRLWDVALSAFTWVPLMKGQTPDAVALARRGDRLATFCAAYGGADPAAVLAALCEELPFMASVLQREADAGDPGSLLLASWGVPGRAGEDVARIRAQTDALLRR